MAQDGTWLEPAPVTPLTGDESLSGTGTTVRDFWSFALSDLKTNIARGVLAEFLVARAVGAQEAVHVSWDNFDVRTPEGIGIEVKSSAYLQGWRQKVLSTIRFSGLKGLAWDDKEGWGAEREVRADVFVFGIQTRKTHEDYDALDVAQWDWYVASASSVVEHGARSVGMGFLERYAEGPLGYDEIDRAVRTAARS
jgi:hypothetical protein